MDDRSELLSKAAIRRKPCEVCFPGNSTLIVAAKYGDVKLCSELIDDGFDVNYRLKITCNPFKENCTNESHLRCDNDYQFNWLPLSIAAYYGHRYVCSLLMEHGAKPWEALAILDKYLQFAKIIDLSNMIKFIKESMSHEFYSSEPPELFHVSELINGVTKDICFTDNIENLNTLFNE